MSVDERAVGDDVGRCAGVGETAGRYVEIERELRSSRPARAASRAGSCGGPIRGSSVASVAGTENSSWSKRHPLGLEEEQVDGVDRLAGAVLQRVAPLHPHALLARIEIDGELDCGDLGLRVGRERLVFLLVVGLPRLLVVGRRVFVQDVRVPEDETPECDHGHGAERRDETPTGRVKRRRAMARRPRQSVVVPRTQKR